MATVTLSRPRLVARIPGGLLIVFALLILLFAAGATVSDRFTSTGNLLNIFEQSAGLALVSLGQTLVVLTGGIDLAVGSLISLCAVLTSGLINGYAGLVIPVIGGILVLGLVVG